MPRTKEEIEKRVEEISQETDTILKLQLKLKDELSKKNNATIEDKVLNEALYAYNQKLTQEMMELLMELITL